MLKWVQLFPVDISNNPIMEQCVGVSPEHAHFTALRWIPTSDLLTLSVVVRRPKRGFQEHFAKQEIRLGRLLSQPWEAHVVTVSLTGHHRNH